MKKLLSLSLIVVLLVTMTCSGALASRGDLIRFIPTTITVSTNSVKVEGYFVNLNSYETVSNFTEFEMSVYHNGSRMTNGSFGTINSFSIPPMGVKYQSFTFNGRHNLSNGTITCDDTYYATFSCRFNYSSY